MSINRQWLASQAPRRSMSSDEFEDLPDWAEEEEIRRSDAQEPWPPEEDD